MGTRTGIDVLAVGRRVVESERDGLAVVLTRLDERFVEAVDRVLACRGRVAVTGMGKAGLIGAKIAATLSSTGTPAYVLHPAEAIHGDLGMVSADDVILALSNSGESQELSGVIPIFARMGCPVLVITGRPESMCGKLANVVLDIGRHAEACPLGMAPSTSTTAMLAMGDALALAVAEVKGLSHEQYAAVHPGGALGRSLMRVEEVMRTDNNCPLLAPEATVQDYSDLLLTVPRRAGAALIADGDGRLIGFFSHGDLNRLLSKGDRPGRHTIRDVMTRDPKCVTVGQRVGEALKLMQKYRIDEVPVVDADHRAVGMIDIQDLLAAGFSLFDAR